MGKAQIEKPTRAELEARHATLSSELANARADEIDLLKTGVEPIEYKVDQNFIDAHKRIYGTAPAPHALSSGNRLFIATRRREQIEAELKLVESALTRIKYDEADEICADIADAWKRNVTRHAALHVEMRKLADERLSLRQEWNMRAGIPVVPPGYIYGSALFVRETPLMRFIEELRRLKLVEVPST
jgi:hypothetical protein